MVEFETALLAIAAAFVLFAVVALYRVYAGPTNHDRVIAVNVAGTNTVIAITLVAAAYQESTFLDVALVYALLNFLLSIAFSKFNVERGGVL
ncbi:MULTISPECIES: cation:proton antiporter [Halorubrum]|uniref:Multicomponent Na+:H+ antiporter subunit F n=1 Tax=Halorubrum sodomense TaxID=35743 RepID=A0A1I6GPT3_HALSD|nr:MULTISPECIES: cation:proton antiporter [Halorubrum]TKX55213.1 cation:proton antiporter [Halorubrum sp. SP3]TKX70273.1 cation:proton antiporter [Halorubrum sp. SP9]SFR44178.1 multicomponent Na+:H+ antiporter subunit F [Halorubrum sodomense]